MHTYRWLLKTLRVFNLIVILAIVGLALLTLADNIREVRRT